MCVRLSLCVGGLVECKERKSIKSIPLQVILLSSVVFPPSSAFSSLAAVSLVTGEMAFRRNTIRVYVMAQWTIHSLPADDGEPDRVQWGLNRVSSLLYTVPVLVADLNRLLIQSHPPTQYSIATFKLECVYCDSDNLIVWPSTTSPDLIVICYFDWSICKSVWQNIRLTKPKSNCETRLLIKYWSGLYYDTTCCLLWMFQKHILACPLAVTWHYFSCLSCDQEPPQLASLRTMSTHGR